MSALYLIWPICFPRPSVFVFLGSLAFIALPHSSAAEEVIDIGSRRQLFLGDHLIGKLKGVRQELHSPVRRDIAINRSILGRNMACRTWSPFETRESFELGIVLTDRLLIRRNAIP